MVLSPNVLILVDIILYYYYDLLFFFPNGSALEVRWDPFSFLFLSNAVHVAWG